MKRDGFSVTPSATGGTLANHPGGPTDAGAANEVDVDDDDAAGAAGVGGIFRGTGAGAVALVRAGGVGISRRGCAPASGRTICHQRSTRSDIFNLKRTAAAPVRTVGGPRAASVGGGPRGI
jgi:hypothetical protein